MIDGLTFEADFFKNFSENLFQNFFNIILYVRFNYKRERYIFLRTKKKSDSDQHMIRSESLIFNEIKVQISNVLVEQTTNTQLKTFEL